MSFKEVSIQVEGTPTPLQAGEIRVHAEKHQVLGASNFQGRSLDGPKKDGGNLDWSVPTMLRSYAPSFG